MKCRINIYSLLLIIVLVFSCEDDELTKKESDTDLSFFSKYTERTFSMGFST